jgi:hypothetical protein
MTFLPLVVAGAMIVSEDRLGQPAFQLRGFRQQDLAHARELRSRVGGSLGAVAGDQNVDVRADLQRGRQGLGSLVRQRGVVVFGDEENCHGLFSFRP